MAPRGTAVNLSFTVDSASEDDTRDELNAFPTPDSNTENKAPTRKPRGNAAQMAKAALAPKAMAKAKTAARRVSGDSVLGGRKQGPGVTKRAGAKSSRKVLVERHDANGSDTEDVDEFDGEEEVVAPVQVKTTRRGRPPKAKHAVEDEEDAAEEPAPAKRTRKAAVKEPAPKKESKSNMAIKSQTTRRAAATEPEPELITIPETQPEPESDAMDVEQSIELDEIPELTARPQRPSARRLLQQPRTARQTSAAPRRAGSVSDTERDPVLRRKVGELTKKLETMTTKHDTLKEVASSSKESNFDQLKRRTEQTIKDQDAVIKALKQQLSEVQSRSFEITTLRKDMAKLESETARLHSENKKLANSLTSAQNESKTLSSKLAAARSSVSTETKSVLGSAAKPRSTVVLPGSAEAAKEAQFQKHKVELYSDLTNLVVLGVKKNEDDEDVYDCLQTGLNGTLHFHLIVAPDADSYAETEFTYYPLLDEQRDKDLIDLLPDFLTEEIVFPRAQAANFYRKVIDKMSKKYVLEEE